MPYNMNIIWVHECSLINVSCLNTVSIGCGKFVEFYLMFDYG